MMACCDYCGNECTLPFTCQYCGGTFCSDCRLPPVHQCTRIDSWRKKPAPGVGISYGRGGTAKATPGGYVTTSPCKKMGIRREGIPWLKIMITIMIVIMLVFLILALGR